MRLIKLGALESVGGSLQLENFSQPPKAYAILSHVWTTDEVLFEDIQCGTYTNKHGYNKIKLSAHQARVDGYEYLWIDTCCIDKSSSAELSEAINSMSRWYQQASVCYVYLDDVGVALHESGFDDQFVQSRWHTRGWTLQELLAPSLIKFFNRDWTHLGRTSGWSLRDANARDYFLWLLSKATRIDKSFLYGYQRRALASASIALRMHWASQRQTSRNEDVAYCLLGLFDVNMPLLYGEGSTKAFLRLQKEIMKQSDDQSLFAWMRVDTLDRAKASPTHRLHGLLADHPSDFGEASASFRPCKPRLWSDSDSYYLASRGLQIALPLKHVSLNLYLAMLDCVDDETSDHIAIWLRRLDAEKTIFSRVFFDKLVLESSETVKSIQKTGLQLMNVRQTPYGPEELISHLDYRCLRYKIIPDPPTSADHHLLSVTRNPHSTEASWEWLEERTFSNGALTDVVLHIQHVPSSEVMIVRIGCLSGFFIGFNAYHSADPKAAQLFNDQNYAMDLHVPGEEIDLDLDRHECQVRLDIVNSQKSQEPMADAHTPFQLRLSITTSATLDQEHAPPAYPKLDQVTNSEFDGDAAVKLFIANSTFDAFV